MTDSIALKQDDLTIVQGLLDQIAPAKATIDSANLMIDGVFLRLCRVYDLKPNEWTINMEQGALVRVPVIIPDEHEEQAEPKASKSKTKKQKDKELAEIEAVNQEPV